MEGKKVEEYHPDADGQLRNVDELRDLCHELSIALHSLLQQPVVRSAMNPMEWFFMQVAAQAAHEMVCPANEHPEVQQSENGEGELGPLNFPGLDFLKGL